MKRRESFAPPAVGGSSLLVIFAVLCLTVFALLSLSSVQAERRLSDAAAQSVKEYYAADRQAQILYARLRSGEIPEGIREEAGVYVFEIPVSQRQLLAVQVANTAGCWDILRWEAVPVETESDDSLDIWKGTEGKS